jgi:hypothetical protein
MERGTYSVEESEDMAARDHQVRVILAEFRQTGSDHLLLGIGIGRGAPYLCDREVAMRKEQTPDVLPFLTRVEFGPRDQIQQLLNGSRDELKKVFNHVAVIFA